MASQPSTSQASYRKSHKSNQPCSYKEVTGTFLVSYNGSGTSAGDDSSEDDEDEEREGFLDYRDMQAGDNMVRVCVPRQKRVELKDKAGKIHVCHGRFMMTEPYWEVEVKMNKTFLRSAPIYSLRTDWDVVKSTNMVMIFLSDCLQALRSNMEQNAIQTCFEQYCWTKGLKDRLTFMELRKTLINYIKEEKSQGCFLGRSPNRGFGNLPEEDHSESMITWVLNSALGASVLAAVSLPQLVRTLSNLFPYAFTQILCKLSQQDLMKKRKMDMEGEGEDGDSKNEDGENDGGEMKRNKSNQQPARLLLADAMAKDSPWEFCFREILKRKLKLYGVEASLKAYEDSSFLSRTPVTQKDALYIYEVMKTDAKRHGHVYIPFKLLRDHYHFRKLDYQISGLERWKSALAYLETNGVTNTETFDRDKNIFLHHNWQAEVDTAEVMKLVLDSHQSNPLIWDVDLFSPEFKNLRTDEDQLRACLLICSTPIVVMSGRGGCGKTTVITCLLKHLCNREQKRLEEEREKRKMEKILDNKGQEKSKDESSTSEFNPLSKTLEKSKFQVPDKSKMETTNPSSVTLEGSVSEISLSAQCGNKQSSSPCVDTALQHQPMPVASSDLSSTLDQGPSGNNSYTVDQTRDAEFSKSNPKAGTQRRRGQTKEEILKQELVSDLLKILASGSSDRDDPELEDFKEKMLLTAPTGKAARLLGCKADLPSATLHSVLASWQAYIKGLGVLGEWKYAQVQILVVDECSLVSTRLFASVVKILWERANLRKIVLLGDIRQLPSIEPGDFLKDMFKTLNSIGVETAGKTTPNGVESGLGMFNLALELRHNHRSESQLIVDNAELISHMKTPNFDSQRNFHLVKTPLQGQDNERDVAIRQLLQSAPDLSSHLNSQFVAFRRAHCTAINELCCHHYNGHSIKKLSKSSKREKFNFRVGDKICLTQNNQVPSSHKVYLHVYMDQFPELKQALKIEDCRLKEMQKKKAEEDECSGQESRQGSKATDAPGAQAADRVKTPEKRTVGLDATGVLELLEKDDAVFDTTIAEMRKGEDVQREDRIQRAREKEKKWKKKAEDSVKLTNGLVRSLGKNLEKLCNGEVFFIMDEMEHFEERNDPNKSQSGKALVPTKYLLLSDRDPDMPRVVCVPFNQLRKLCKMRHSWARTIHTYQGSESDTVVYVLGAAIPQTWQHVYTAVTRGRKSVFVLGNWEQLHIAISRCDTPRRTRLSHRLQESLRDQAECVEMCRQEFLSNQRAYTNSVSAPSVDQALDADWAGDDFGSDDSWLLQAITQQEQIDMDGAQPGACTGHNEDAPQELTSTQKFLAEFKEQTEKYSSFDAESNQNLELGRDCVIISSSSDSEEEEESIFASLTKHREKKSGISLLKSTGSEKLIDREKGSEDDDDCVPFTQTQLIEQEENFDSLEDDDDIMLLDTMSKPELGELVRKLPNVHPSETNSSDRFSQVTKQQEWHDPRAKGGDQIAKPSYSFGHCGSFPSSSAVQSSDISSKFRAERAVSSSTESNPASLRYQQINDRRTPPKPSPHSLHTSPQLPLHNQNSSPNQPTRTPIKRLLEDGRTPHNDSWRMSEVSPTKLQRTSSAVGTPFLESFSESLLLDTETDWASPQTGRDLEESPLPVRRKL